MATNPFEQFGPAKAPATPGPVYGAPPKPDKPPAPPSGFRPTPEGNLEPIPGGPADKPVKNRDVDDVLYEMRNVVAAAERAKKLSKDGWFATGFGAPQAAGVGGTSASTIEGDLNTIGASTAFDRLQRMREESPTGGALGQVAVKELELLRDSISSLSIAQNDEAFQASMDRVIDSYNRMIAKIDPDGVGTSNVIYPKMARDIPEGSQTEMGAGLKAAESFDRDEWLKAFGFNRNSEATLVATLNANRGNKNITAEDVAEIYRKSGAEGVPTQADLEDVAEALRAGTGQWAPFDESSAKTAETSKLDAEIERRGADPESMGTTIGTKATQGFAMGGLDELMGIVGGVNALEEGKSFGEGYELDRDIMRRRLERSEEANPKTALISEIGGSVVNPVGVNKFQSARSMADVAKVGAMLGGTEGFLRGEGVAGSIGGGVGGAAIGAPVAAGLTAVGRPIANKFNELLGRSSQAELAAQRGVAENVMAAGQETGTPVRMADLRPELAGQRAQAKASEYGGPMVEKAEATDLAAMENAMLNVGGGNLNRDPFGTGRVIQRGLDDQATRSKALRNETYNMVEKFAPDFKANPVQTIAAIDTAIAGLQANAPRGSDEVIRVLEKVKQDFADTGLSTGSLQAQREVVRGLTNQTNIDMTRAESILSNVLKVAGQELTGALKGAGKGRAAQALEKANRDTAIYHDFRQQVAKKLLGPDNQPFPPETTAANIESWLRPGRGGDFERVSRVWKELSPPDRQDFASAVASNMGRDRKGNFSLPILLNNLDPKTGILSPRSAEMIFGKEGLSAMRSLKLLAEKKLAAGAGTNTSRTGNVLGPQAAGTRRAILSLLGLGVGDTTGAAAAYVGSSLLSRIGEKRMARLVTSPDVAKWVASLPETAGDMTKALARLDAIASRSPAIAADLMILREEAEKGQSPPVPVR